MVKARYCALSLEDLESTAVFDFFLAMEETHQIMIQVVPSYSSSPSCAYPRPPPCSGLLADPRLQLFPWRTLNGSISMIFGVTHPTTGSLTARTFSKETERRPF